MFKTSENNTVGFLTNQIMKKLNKEDKTGPIQSVN